MSYDFETALSDPLICLVSRDDSMGVFEVQIGDLKTVVTIQLGRFMDSDKTKFSVSHAIRTPLQADQYRTSHRFGDYPGYALYRAISGLTDYYRAAVKDGHKPSEGWLVNVNN